ncbi:hypothetical protein SERLA73DRAFT_83299 [Serpula lacrymans var. lacrymans S7.3]|uniref:amidase n=2 Tax=Serpula lacrymans var. lacrymans TaxID=341189 RepID=F8PIJ1_SERL3|nr:uncharacterized protein SERLADRAFT_353895 [Serpula lacrymans var. lacrymans S7.9]EGO03362.1 hypothetical protein SERLA73DRAFT_83299 [Serpula lacrymans var. lacrymans S7.3]EGO29134.1 hypothetical protein SERLADRAFT_353895 [Serpula lacrymans var. lacrymans S7.9]
MLFSYLAHRRACMAKQQERQNRIDDLNPVYHEPLTAQESHMISLPISALISSVHSDSLSPTEILLAYGKQALKAHRETNCLTEIMISDAEHWANGCNKDGPLAGVPVSLKDEIGVKGWDACIGYSAWVGRPRQDDSAMVRLLRDAGAVPFVKTNVPVTLMSFESGNDVFGRTTNPFSKAHTAGGSSGGEGALIACGGSRIGVGTDVAGSIRVPAHWSGMYAIRASVGRFPKTGSPTSVPGQEFVPAVHSPMARTLEDLETFFRAVIEMKPWEYDHSALHMPWRSVRLEADKPMKWGIMWDDGVVIPSPACHRALDIVARTLKAHGHNVVTIKPPSPYEGFVTGSQLLFADASKTSVHPIRTGDQQDAGVIQAQFMASLPRWVKRVYAWYLRYIRGDEVFAGLMETWHEKTVSECWALVARREEYRKAWFDMWRETDIDFVLTVPNPTPAVPHGGMKQGFIACGYTFLFNMLDYSAGVLPVTRVDSAKDVLPASFKARNTVEAGVYELYDAKAMHGLPVGVQVVGKRLDEEKVLEAMKIVEKLLMQDGLAYPVFTL